MMTRMFYIALVLGCLFVSGCAYNSRSNTFGWAPTERPVKPPAYPIPDLSPTASTQESQAYIPPPAEY